MFQIPIVAIIRELKCHKDPSSISYVGKW